MKKIVFIAFMVVAAMVSNGQSWNPYVNQGTITPASILPLEFQGEGIASFNIGNTGSNELVFDNSNPDNNLTLLITFKNGIPNKNNPLAAIKGDWKDKFSWSYDATTNTLTGLQKKTIGGYSNGNIIIDYGVTYNTSISTAANGFNVRVIPPAYLKSNHTQDDEVSSYTYTGAYDYGDAPSSYGSAIHEINLVRDAISGKYTKYIYLGQKVDQESDNLFSMNSMGDDDDNSDDEDGVTFPELIAGTTVNIPVVITAHDESYGILNAWFDWNGDGDFIDAGEKVSSTPLAAYSSGTYNLSVTIPETAITTQSTYSRFRIGANSGPTTANQWGEVEDYEIAIKSANIENPTEIAVNTNINEIILSSERESANVILTWETPTENNTVWFVVERSVNGGEFVQIGDRIMAAGNSNTTLLYTFADLNVNSDNATYRIILLGNDNTEIMSNTITEILDNGADINISLYPNPVREVYTVSVDRKGSYVLELMDIHGRIVSNSTMEVTGDKGMKLLNRNGVITGNYFLRVTDKSNRLTKTIKVIMLDQ